MAPRDLAAESAFRLPASQSDSRLQDLWIEMLLNTTRLTSAAKTALTDALRVGDGQPFDRLERALTNTHIRAGLDVPAAARGQQQTLADALDQSVRLWRNEAGSGRNFLRDYSVDELLSFFPRVGAVTAAEWRLRVSPQDRDIPPREALQEFAQVDLGLTPARRYAEWRVQMLAVYEDWRARTAPSSPGNAGTGVADWLNIVSDYRRVARVVTDTASSIGLLIHQPVANALPDRATLDGIKLPQGMKFTLTSATMEYLRDFFGYDIDPVRGLPKEGSPAYKDAVKLFMRANQLLGRAHNADGLHSLQRKVELHYNNLGEFSRLRNQLCLEAPAGQGPLNLPAGLMPRGNLRRLEG